MKKIITLLFIVSSALATFTQTEVTNILDGRYHSFIQDIADSEHTIGDPQDIDADTEYLFTIDALARNFVIAPDYMTDRWDAVNSKIAPSTEMNTPTYVADIGFTFAPTVSAAGTVTVRMYIDDASPKQIRSYQFSFKGTPENVNQIMTWYLGTDAGYDAKNDGVYITVEFSAAGELYSKTAVIYHT